MIMNTVFHSPDKKQALRFEDINEIRMGPSYGRILLNEILLPFHYGMDYLWSEDSRYLALQQWLSVRESQGPHTRIALIDTMNSRIAYCRSVNGFVEPKLFENEKLVIQKRIFSANGEAGGEFEISIPSISNWTDIPKKPIGFREAVDFILIPQMEQIGFTTKGIAFSSDGDEVVFENGESVLAYRSFGRLDPPSLSLKYKDSVWLDYQQELHKYVKSENLPSLEDTVSVIKVIDHTFLHVLEQLKLGQRSPKLDKIKIGSKEIMVRMIYSYPEFGISILANENESSYFIGFMVPVGDSRKEIMAYDKLSASEISQWMEGELNVQSARDKRTEKAMREMTRERKEDRGKPLIQSSNRRLAGIKDIINRMFRR
jgi:hypothetical protein